MFNVSQKSDCLYSSNKRLYCGGFYDLFHEKETRLAGWKKITMVDEKELFFTDFERTCPVCLFTIFYAQASENWS